MAGQEVFVELGVQGVSRNVELSDHLTSFISGVITKRKTIEARSRPSIEAVLKYN